MLLRIRYCCCQWLSPPLFHTSICSRPSIHRLPHKLASKFRRPQTSNSHLIWSAASIGCPLSNLHCIQSRHIAISGRFEDGSTAKNLNLAIPSVIQVTITNIILYFRFEARSMDMVFSFSTKIQETESRHSSLRSV